MATTLRAQLPEHHEGPLHGVMHALMLLLRILIPVLAFLLVDGLFSRAIG